MIGTQRAPAHRRVATVLIIAADPSIEALVGELVAFVGHRPVYDATAGAAGESVRRIRPDVTVVDTALPRPVVDSCLGASDEVGSQPILMSSTDSAIELEQQARLARRLYFALPAGPKPLASVLDRAIAKRATPAPIVVPQSPPVGRAENGSVHPALCAALASLARSPFQERAAEPRGHAALRAAVTDYARQLKATEVPVERVVNLVQVAVSYCASAVGAEAWMPVLLAESEQWARSA